MTTNAALEAVDLDKRFGDNTAFVANTFASTSTMPTWLRTIAEWNPVSSLTQSLREVCGNGPEAPPSAAWPLHHAALTTVVWSVLIAAVIAPLALAAFRHRSRD